MNGAIDLSVAIRASTYASAESVLRAAAELLEPADVRIEFLVYLPAPERDPLPAEIGCFPLRVHPLPDSTYRTFMDHARTHATGLWLATIDEPCLRDAPLLFAFWLRRAEGDVLIASRHALGADTDAPLVRRWASRCGNKLVAAALSFPVADMTGGRRMYRLRVIRDIQLESHGRELLIEILVRAFGKGARVVEIPWHTERSSWPMPSLKDVAKVLRRMHHVRNSGNYPDYDSRAYHSKIWLQRYWQQKRYAIISRFSNRAGRALDIGCGGSRIIKTRPDMIALDLNFDRLRHLEPTNPWRVQATAGALPFVDRAFDTVICSQVIEHTLEGTCVTECARVLKDGGILVIGTPDYGRVWWPLWERLYEIAKPHGYVIEHIAHYTYASLVREVTEAGCEVLEHAYIAGGELIVKAVKRPRQPAS